MMLGTTVGTTRAPIGREAASDAGVGRATPRPGPEWMSGGDPQVLFSMNSSARLDTRPRPGRATDERSLEYRLTACERSPRPVH